ncbi:hypothetical protein QFZ47_000241 [Variovorax paradoxus]|nr:hypothetical protein [Variovorax paradoxus]
MVCRCGLGLASGLEVELGEVPPLMGRVDCRPREIGLRGDREDLLGRGWVRELAARDLQVQRCALLQRNRGVGRFTEAIVAEHPVVVLAAGAAGLERRLERRFEAAQRIGARHQVRCDGKRFARGTVAEAGKQLQHGLRRARQLFEAARQQVDDVVDTRMGRDSLQAPAPGRGRRVVGKQAVVGEQPEQVLGKKRVALGLVADHLGERTEGIGILLQRQRDQFAQSALVERAEFHGHRIGHFGEPTRAQRMMRVHLLGAERADQQQRLVGILVKQAFENLQGSHIRPLQVVQPQQQRSRGRSKARQQACHAVEHALPFECGCGVWWFRCFGLRAEHHGQGGKEAGQGAIDRSGRRADPILPDRKFVLGAAEHELQQLLERLHQDRVGPAEAAFLALDRRQERRARLLNARHGLAQQYRFTDARWARDPGHARSRTDGDFAIERVQRLELGIAAQYLLCAQHPVQRGVGVEREKRDASLLALQRLAAAQIRQHARSVAIAVMGRLLEEFQDQQRQLRWDALLQFAGRAGLLRRMRVDPFRDVFALERRPADQQFVKDATE